MAINTCRLICICTAVLAVSMAGMVQATPSSGNAVEALIANSKAAMRSSPEESKRDAEAALDLLKHNPNADQEVMAYLQLCDYYSERDSALAEKQAALIDAILPRITRQGLRAGAFQCRGEIAESKGDYTRAIALYDESVKSAHQYGDDELLAEGLFQRGYAYGVQGQYANGLADLQEAQTLFEKVHQPQYALTVLSSVATLYNRLGDYAQALHIYQRALPVQHRENMQREEVVTNYNIGAALEHLQRWDEARDSFNNALQLSQQLNYTRGEVYAMRGLAAVATARGNPQAALEILNRAGALQKDVADVRLQGQMQLARGMALLKLQRTAESIAALEEAKDVFNGANSLNELATVYAQLALAYAQQGNWHKAYDIRSDGQRISESVLRNQLDQRFATLKIEFDTANKEKENAMLTRENAANQLALEHAATAHRLQTAVIALSTMLLLLLGTMVWHQRRGKQHMRNLAMTDELTGVPNRRWVLRQLDSLLLKRDDGSCAMLIIDIDHFKGINDKYGHPIGDEVIRAVVDRLRKVVHAPAFSGRLGGEEFILVLPDHSVEMALDVAENLRIMVSELDLGNLLGERRITISIGMTMAVINDTPSTMLRRADDALYAAKHAGRNCVRCEPPLDVINGRSETADAASSITMVIGSVA
ncbi:MAG TPA: diguanylate cyclase [Steroidobacteraceae bacterium]|nr:diguanylate cyclase [Steroidobacteraceae bacterium]